MIIKIDEAALEKNNLTVKEVITLAAYYYDVDIGEESKDMSTRKLLIPKDSSHTNFRLSNLGVETFENSILDTDNKIEVSSIEELAKQLKEIYPKGKKPGSNLYWAEGVPLIVRRLKLFYKKYGDTYTNEQIIEATKSYIESQNGIYDFMRVLKYFIFKEVKGAAGEVEGTSDLLNCIENAGDNNDIMRDWTNTLK